MELQTADHPVALPPTPSTPLPRVTKVQTALLIGAVRSGKSTIINYLVNYFGEGKLETPKIVIPNHAYTSPTERDHPVHSEAGSSSTMRSRTKACTTYTFQRGNSLWRFIDTPGVSNASASTNEDLANTIMAAVEQAVELHAIIWVVSSSAPYMTLGLKAILQRLAATHPNLLPGHLIAVYTYCSVSHFQAEHSYLPPRKSFAMNNCALEEMQDEWDTEVLGYQKIDWNRSMQTLGEMVTFVEGLPSLFTVQMEKLGFRQDIEGKKVFVPTEIEMTETLIRLLAGDSDLLNPETVQPVQFSRKSQANPAVLLHTLDAWRADSAAKRALSELENSRTVLLIEETPGLADYLVSAGQKYTFKLTSPQCVLYSLQRGSISYNWVVTSGLGIEGKDQIEEVLKGIRWTGNLCAVVLALDELAPSFAANLKTTLQLIKSCYPDVLPKHLITINTRTRTASSLLPYQPAQSFALLKYQIRALSAQSTPFDRFCTYFQQKLLTLTTGEIHAAVDGLNPKEMAMSSELLKEANRIKGAALKATSDIERLNVLREKLEKDCQAGVEIANLLNQYEVKQKIYEKGVVNSMDSPMQLSALLGEISVLKQIPKTLQRFYYKRQETNYHSTICRICKVTCHNGCSLGFTAVMGDNIFKECACMACGRLDFCQKCNCDYTTHVHDRCIFEKEVIVEGTVCEEIAVELLKRQVLLLHLEAKRVSLEEEERAAKLSAEKCAELIGTQPEFLLAQQKEEALRKQQEAEKALITTKLEESKIMNQRTQTDLALQDTKEALVKAQSMIEAQCRDLQKVCSRRQFLEGLSVTQLSLVASLSSLGTEEAKNQAECFVLGLNQFVYVLEEMVEIGESQQPVSG